jgi:uncharacterized protein (DUF169 family)
MRKKKRDSKRNSQGESLEQLLHMSSRPVVVKLRDSRWKSQEEEERAQEKLQAEQKATVEEEPKEKEQGKITGRVTRRLLSIMTRRLVTKLVDS